MDAINSSVNTTKGKLQERIDQMVNEIFQLKMLAKTDQHGALKHFIML